jgi:imidazolonepropionase-like amidohydrolase
MPHTIGEVPGRLVIRDLALADGTSAQLQLGIAVVIEDGHIQWLGPTEQADAAGAEVMDGGGGSAGISGEV